MRRDFLDAFAELMSKAESVRDATVPGFLQAERTQVLGILNVTPNSFSDGGCWVETEAAIAHGKELLATGADIIDVGGESTAPGAQIVAARTEIERVVPVIRALHQAGAVISCDTRNAQTARAAVAAGAVIINDVSGGLTDTAMFETVAELQKENPELSYICQHWRGHPRQEDPRARYGDVTSEVLAELSGRLELAASAGMDFARIILDPGLGFSKESEHDWELLVNLREIVEPFPVLIGPSRKRFLAGFETLGAEARMPASPSVNVTESGCIRPVSETPLSRHPRDEATAALVMYAALNRVWGVRVHRVAAAAMAVRVSEQLDTVREVTQLRRALQEREADD